MLHAKAPAASQCKRRCGGGRWVLRAAHAARPNTVAGSRRNIEEHYDAGNDMVPRFPSPRAVPRCFGSLARS